MNENHKSSLALNGADRFAFVAMAVIPLALIFGMFGGYFWEKARDSVRPTVAANSSETFELKGAPGQKLTFYVTEDNVLGDRWDTTGLKMILGDKAGMVVPEHREDWGEAISTGSSGGTTQVKMEGTLQVPEADVGREIEGRITGSVDFPKASGGGEFSNVGRNVEIPVILRVISWQEAESLVSDRQGLSPTIYPLLLGAGVALLGAGIVAVAAFNILDRRIKKGQFVTKAKAVEWTTLAVMVALVAGIGSTWWFINDRQTVVSGGTVLGEFSEFERQQEDARRAKSEPKQYKYTGDGGYSLTIPAGWQEFEKLCVTDMAGTLHAAPLYEFISNCTDRPSLVTVYTVNKEEAIKLAKWETTCEQAKDNSYRSATTCEELRLGDNDWLKLTYKTTDEAAPTWRNSDVVSYMTYGRDRAYGLNYIRPAGYPDEMAGFESIVKSFKFE